MFNDLDRRRVLTVLGAAVLLPATGIGRAAEQEEEEVEALEDLMREHGVLRRALLVYAEAATRLARGEGGEVPLGALRDTAALFRSSSTTAVAKLRTTSPLSQVVVAWQARTRTV